MYNKVIEKNHDNVIDFVLKILNDTLKNDNQYGGNSVFGVVVDNEKINNPELLYLTNPTWPPTINSNVNVKDPSDNKWYKGTIKNVIWNSTACVIKLDPSYVFQENTLRDYPEFDGGNNHYLLLPSYHWQYTDQDKFNSVQPSINDVVEKTIINSSIGEKNQVSLIPDVVKPNGDINIEDHKINSNQFFLGTEKINVTVDKNDTINKKVINNFQKFKTNMEPITPEMLIDANNPYYRPMLGLNEIDFAEQKMESKLYNNFKSSITTLSRNESSTILEKLKRFEVINPNDIKFMVNKNISINNLINDPEDEINEGGKIIKNVIKMTKNIFTDLQARIHMGYVYFTRKGGVVQDIVTKKLVPKLNYFPWQEDKPIDYNVLKYVIFQNNYQKSIKENLLQKSEAEAILGLEYIIAVQCKSHYLFWCLKRLLMIWYADKDLEQNIRKIKVLINHYRADPSQDYNKINGILPMIAIYPKYGIENARLLISKLEYYFSLYIEDNFNRTYQEIFYPNSNPSYFLKKNNLIYYTNGSIDLKMYIKESMNCNDKINNDTFDVDMSKLTTTQNVIISTGKETIGKQFLH
jgi:hypothetical protein